MSTVAAEVVSTTGTAVLNLKRQGQFDACLSRTDLCGFACCGFGTLGNFISPLEGEIELARKQGLSFDHLTIIKGETDDGRAFERVQCNRVCAPGEWKSLDCALYPVWPASADLSKWIVADNRKCPIPYDQMLETIRVAQETLIEWEADHKGAIAQAVAEGRDFRAYQAFPYGVSLDGKVWLLPDDEKQAITPYVTLDPSYAAHFTNAKVIPLYEATSTPVSQLHGPWLDEDFRLRPLRATLTEEVVAKIAKMQLPDTATVIAPTLERAVELLKQRHAEGSVHSVWAVLIEEPSPNVIWLNSVGVPEFVRNTLVFAINRGLVGHIKLDGVSVPVYALQA